jgi:SAM-dependent methyltransferase
MSQPKSVVRPPPKPRDSRPSPFVVSCLAERLTTPNELSADLACGYGRHVQLLAKAGYAVVALDIDEAALCFIKRQQTGTFVVRADLRMGLPIAAQSFGLAVAVHYPLLALVPIVATALAPGGYAILESVGGQGQNWRQLPQRGMLRRRVSRKFEVLKLQERPVGPPEANAVVVRALLRRK